MGDTLTFPPLTATHPVPDAISRSKDSTGDSVSECWTLGSLAAAKQLLDRLYADGASECELLVLGPSLYMVRRTEAGS
jgi:hypothetical protein